MKESAKRDWPITTGQNIRRVEPGCFRGHEDWNFVIASSKLELMASTRHCWKCGTEYTLPGAPVRSETCHVCQSDLKVCLNCVSYDPRIAEQCRDRRADLVAEKHLANYCEYFEMIRREFVSPAQDASREAKARDALKKLLGD